MGIYKIYAKYQAAARRRQPGPAPRRYIFVYICIIFGAIWLRFGRYLVAILRNWAEYFDNWSLHDDPLKN